MLDRFKTFAPEGVLENCYGAWTVKSVREKCDEVAADVQKFRE